MKLGAVIAVVAVVGVCVAPAKGDTAGPITWEIDVKTDGALARVPLAAVGPQHAPIPALVPNDWRCTYEPIALVPRGGELVETVVVTCDLKGMGTASTSVGCTRGKPLDRHMAPLLLGQVGKPSAEVHVMCEGPAAPARAYEPFE